MSIYQEMALTYGWLGGIFVLLTWLRYKAKQYYRAIWLAVIATSCLQEALQWLVTKQC